MLCRALAGMCSAGWRVESGALTPMGLVTVLLRGGSLCLSSWDTREFGARKLEVKLALGAAKLQITWFHVLFRSSPPLYHKIRTKQSFKMMVWEIGCVPKEVGFVRMCCRG